MKVSLIIPVYNVAPYLRRCLDSAVRQTWTGYEVILVDDGSTDGSRAICEAYCRKNPGVSLLRQAHRGLMAAWMAGVRRAKGEYIAFLDGDDWVEDDYLEQMALAAEGADVVCCSHVREYETCQIMEKEGTPPGRYDREAIEHEIYPRLLHDGAYLSRGLTPHRWGKLIRRTLLLRNLSWCDQRLTFGEDLNLLFPVMLDCRALVVLDDPRGLYHYRQRPSSIVKQYKPGMFVQLRQLYRRLLQVNRAKGGYDFGRQIKGDSFCLFLEYVKNEAKGGRIDGGTAREIERNYRRMQKDFRGIPCGPVRLTRTDRGLAFCLRSGQKTGILVWLWAYRIVKIITNGKEWKYRLAKKKRKKRPLRVVMAGPDLSVQGGIRTVAAQYLSQADWEGVSLRYIPVYIEKNLGAKMLFFVRGCLRIWLLVWSGQADLVHLHMAERGSFYRKALILAGCGRPGVRTVLHHHGAEFLEFYDRAPGWKRAWIRSTLEAADCNLVLGRSWQRQMEKRFPRGKWQVLWNTVPVPAKRGAAGEGRHLLFAGRLGERKGTFDLLRAMAVCDRWLPEGIRLFLCGDGETARASAMVKELGLTNRVVVTGWRSPAQMEALYETTMLFVLPSYREGLPMALLEAMARGIPCIAGRAGAIPEVIEQGVTGILVTPGDIDGLCRAIRYLCGDAQARRRIGEAGYARVKEWFGLEQGIKELTKIWREQGRKGNGRTRKW